MVGSSNIPWPKYIGEVNTNPLTKHLSKLHPSFTDGGSEFFGPSSIPTLAPWASKSWPYMAIAWVAKVGMYVFLVDVFGYHNNDSCI